MWKRWNGLLVSLFLKIIPHLRVSVHHIHAARVLGPQKFGKVLLRDWVHSIASREIKLNKYRLAMLYRMLCRQLQLDCSVAINREFINKRELTTCGGFRSQSGKFSQLSRQVMTP